MARVDIPGTKTDWVVIRGWIDSMFSELYSLVSADKKGSVEVDEDGTPIIFDTPYPDGTNYIILPHCYASFGDVNYTISNKTVTGFTITSAETATFDYKCEII